MCLLYRGQLWFKCSFVTWKKCPLYGVSALERFCFKGFLRNLSGTNFFVRLRQVSTLEDINFRGFHCPHITSRVSERHHFRAKEDPKRFFMEATFLTDKNNFHVLLHPFQGIKVDSGQKFTQINDNKNRVKCTFVFSSCQGQPLGSCLSFSKSFRTTLV